MPLKELEVSSHSLVGTLVDVEIGSHFQAPSDLHGWFVKRGRLGLMLPAGYIVTLWYHSGTSGRM